MQHQLDAHATILEWQHTAYLPRVMHQLKVLIQNQAFEEELISLVDESIIFQI